jgi:hypothetical protein
VYLTVVYDLERGVWRWRGDDRTDGLLLKNPWNLNHDPKDRLSTWVCWEQAAGPRRVLEGILPTVLEL